MKCYSLAEGGGYRQAPTVTLFKTYDEAFEEMQKKYVEYVSEYDEEEKESFIVNDYAEVYSSSMGVEEPWCAEIFEHNI